MSFICERLFILCTCSLRSDDNSRRTPHPAVSDQAHGTEGFQGALLSRHGTPVRPPQQQEWKPAPESLT